MSETKTTIGILLKLILNWIDEITEEGKEYSYLPINVIFEKLFELQNKSNIALYHFFESHDGPGSFGLMKDLDILLNQRDLIIKENEITVSPSGYLNGNSIKLPEEYKAMLKGYTQSEVEQ